ncbi:DNA (cytosine-5-)-methyltransferase [Pseudoduganella sp. FT25W]|uniref:DNA (cytosine-5-)-methyltransferase n=1 Tax=Duganella alba TaxID=2666081 RepID=A0A6L5QBC3_9BURK|nr:DNA cytosine methyltransferase [Duganella alba]MRX07015.1 DNA (cytosine-5-)-methyltransferase [Duganella alba]MRX16088.1 DNA (cytosine-5-)-methyltransferase [Duganella alba]
MERQLTVENSMPGSTESIEKFSKKGKVITRTIVLRNGQERNSSVTVRGSIKDIADLSDAFDVAWLRSLSLPKTEVVESSTLRVADLFSGCGGLSIGLREACRALGIPVEFVFASDINETALDVYRQNFSPLFSAAEPLELLLDGKVGSKRTSSEIAFIKKLGKVDFVIAGPPCQGHSDLNNHTRRADPKNQLVLRVARFAELFRPKHILIENVQGIRHDKLGSLGEAIKILEKLGYSMSDGVLSAEMFGAAQARKRFFLVASLSELHTLETIPTFGSKRPRTLGWAIDDLRSLQSSQIFDSSASHSQVNRKRIDFLFDNNLYELPNSERPPCHRDKSHSYTGVYGRMHWDRPAPTITTGFGSTGQGRFVHPLERRTLTPHEAARVQFFPDFFDFGDLGRRQYQELIGNAVPSKLAYAIVLNQLR